MVHHHYLPLVKWKTIHIQLVEKVLEVDLFASERWQIFIPVIIKIPPLATLRMMIMSSMFQSALNMIGATASFPLQTTLHLNGAPTSSLVQSALSMKFGPLCARLECQHPPLSCQHCIWLERQSLSCSSLLCIWLEHQYSPDSSTYYTWLECRHPISTAPAQSPISFSPLVTELWSQSNCPVPKYIWTSEVTSE